MCGSMNPGMMVRSAASMRCAPAGILTSDWSPTASTEPFRTTTRPGENRFSGVNTAPPSMISGAGARSLTSAAEVSQHLSQIAIAFLQAFFRLSAAASYGAHDDGNLQLTARLLG